MRRYPPLVTLVVALLITVVVLPSALTLPNANPTTVLEYAPIPPEDDDPPPPQDGSLSTLGLGTSRGLAPVAEGGGAALPLPGGKGTIPITKRCVGKPLRQSEDPNAPPCVPHFEGDNGGKTWQGVTKDEVTVIVYASLVISTGGDQGPEQPPPAGSYCDVDGPPNTDPACLDDVGLRDHFEVRRTRAMSRYFNERFQTYGRHVHFWVYYSGANSPAGRRADASDNWQRLKPFAVIDNAVFGGNNLVYADAMARRNTSVYGNFVALPNKIYREFAPFVWSFWPDLEHWAANYVSYVCQKIAPYPTVHHAGGGLQGKPRKYALMYADDARYPGLRQFGQLVDQGLQDCPNGAKVPIAERVTFPRHQYSADTHPDAATAARSNVAKMQAAGVTTVLWAGGYETEHSKAAFNSNWLPEWVVAGDLLNDQIEEPRFQQQDAWRYARTVSNQIREEREEDAPCRQAYREAEPNGADADDACGVYRMFFQLFRSIQVAGPDLSPYTVDQGAHAIQRSASPSPFVAACFFDPGDYTCVKDAQESWWDPDAPDPEGEADERGCWRMVREGKRYLAGTWEGTDRDAFANKADPCNIVGDNSAFINPYGPAG